MIDLNCCISFAEDSSKISKSQLKSAVPFIFKEVINNVYIAHGESKIQQKPQCPDDYTPSIQVKLELGRYPFHGDQWNACNLPVMVYDMWDNTWKISNPNGGGLDEDCNHRRLTIITSCKLQYSEK
jgi:hypothetical protein